MRCPSPDLTTLVATRKATTTRRTLPLAKPAKALAGVIVLVSTAAAAASKAAVSSGKAVTMTEKIAAAKIANRCQAWLVNPAGVSTSQRPITSANVAARLSRTVRRLESDAVTDLVAVADARAVTDGELPPPASSRVP